LPEISNCHWKTGGRKRSADRLLAATSCFKDNLFRTDPAEKLFESADVFETVVGVLSAGASGYASPLVSVAGLLLWTGGSLGAAVGLLRWRIE
jgi:hypothetical protein